jgi:type III secretion protein D
MIDRSAEPLTENRAEQAALQLRVLSGLHQGAAMALEAPGLCIGADAESDVMLLDPGIAPLHVRLDRAQGLWHCHAIADAPVRTYDGQNATSVPLHEGLRLYLGAVLIGFEQEHTPWSARDSSLEQLQALHQKREPGDGQAIGGSAMPARVSKRGSGAVAVLPLVCAGVLCLVFASAAAYSSWRAAATEAQPPVAWRPTSLTAPQAARPVEAAVAASDKPQPGALASRQAATMAERAVLARKLARDFGLRELVEVTTQGEGLVLRAELTQAERARFEQLLVSLQRRLGAGIALQAHVEPAQRELPFMVRQILMGAQSYVVLDDGRRVYEGQQLAGYRLESIRAGSVVFQGKRRVEMPW